VSEFLRAIAETGRYVSHEIQFDTASARLRPESARVLQLIGEALQADPTLKLRIEGHTDATGTAAGNLRISQLRANAVRQELVRRFRISPGRLTAQGLGATRPIAGNETEEERAKNRRVEFVKQ
jgi:outer membrane protein OmpA-like peptidoglycan-associated protein